MIKPRINFRKQNTTPTPDHFSHSHPVTLLPRYNKKTKRRKHLKMDANSLGGRTSSQFVICSKTDIERIKNKLTIHLRNASRPREGILTSELRKHAVHQLAYPILELPNPFQITKIKEDSVPVIFV